MNQGKIWGKSIPRRGNNKCERPDEGLGLGMFEEQLAHVSEGEEAR